MYIFLRHLTNFGARRKSICANRKRGRRISALPLHKKTCQMSSNKAWLLWFDKSCFCMNWRKKDVWIRKLEILHLFFILTSFPGPSIMKEVRIDKPSNQWLAVWLGWSQIPTGPLYMTWLTSDISQFGKFPSMRPTESASLLFWKSLAKCSLMIEYFFCFYEFTMQSLYIHNTKFGSAVLELAKDLRGLLNYRIWQYQLWSFKSWDTKLLRE